MPLVFSQCPVLVAGTALDSLRPDLQLIVAMQDSKLVYMYRRKSVMAFTGQTLFRTLAAAKAGTRYKLLFQPCETASMALQPLHPEAEFSTLLERFNETRLGFALVSDGDKFGVVRLADVISLYGSGVIATNASLADMASRAPLRMSLKATLSEVIDRMLREKVRRLFITEEPRAFASDREILDFLLSNESLTRARDSPQEFLESTLSDVPWRPAQEFDGSKGVMEALDTYQQLSGAWCGLVDGHVLTPWDLVMEPWLQGRLRTGEAVPVKH